MTDACILARAEALDALDAILPFDRRDQLAELLSDDDVRVLVALAEEGMPDNTLRALASDLGYLEAWSAASTGVPLPWPAPQSMILEFIAHHLWQPADQQANPVRGMPAEVDAYLRGKELRRADGPHAVSTVKRRLASWSRLTKARGLEGCFADPAIAAAIRLAAPAGRHVAKKSRPVVTGKILDQLLATCTTESLADLRDRALLLTAFASGGRRRSELAALRVEDLADPEPGSGDPSGSAPPSQPRLSIRLAGGDMSGEPDVETLAFMAGAPVVALKRWLAAAGIETGPVFRRIDQWGNVDWRPMSPQSMTWILKSRCEKAGLDPKAFSSHALRAGYLKEAASKGVPLREAMQQSRHRSRAQAASYYPDRQSRKGKAPPEDD